MLGRWLCICKACDENYIGPSHVRMVVNGVMVVDVPRGLDSRI